MAVIGVTNEDLQKHPQISLVMRRAGISKQRMIEVLRADFSRDSLAIVEFYDSLTKTQQEILSVEAIALGARSNPRRMWELYCGANLSQSREVVSVMIAASLPEIMAKTIEDAMTEKGLSSREHIYKAARVFPSPKGNTTNINLGPQSAELQESGEEKGYNELEPADEFLMRASKAMSQKMLGPPVEIDAEVEEMEME